VTLLRAYCTASQQESSISHYQIVDIRLPWLQIKLYLVAGNTQLTSCTNQLLQLRWFSDVSVAGFQSRSSC